MSGRPSGRPFCVQGASVWTIWPIIPPDDRTAWLVRHYRDVTSDYEDGLVLAACELCKARYLVAHDKKLAAQANIAMKTAAEMTDLIVHAHRC